MKKGQLSIGLSLRKGLKDQVDDKEQEQDRRVKFADYVVEEGKKGSVVFAALDDYVVAPLDDFIRQPADAILYDLNRLPEVVLTFIDDRKWVNDYAVYQVIKRLRELMPEWHSVDTVEPPLREAGKRKPYVLALDAKERHAVGWFYRYSTGELGFTSAKAIGAPVYWTKLLDPPEVKE